MMATCDSSSLGLRVFPQIEAIVFDMDGTLIDSLRGIESALRLAFRQVERAMPDVDLRRIVGPPITVIARSIEPSLSDLELNTIERSFRATYDRDGWRDVILYPDVAETLKVLHGRGFRLFVVTNKPLSPASSILSHFGLGDMFAEVLTRDSRQPHYSSKIDMLADLLSGHNLQPGTTLMVGDTSEDQEAAQRNGLDFIHVAYGYGLLTTPARRVRAFSGIAAHLEASAGPSSNFLNKGKAANEI